MKTKRTSPDLLSLLETLAERVQRLLETDAELAGICAELARSGHAPLLTVEPATGGAPPRVVCAGRPTVPEWSEQDAEVLRSVGIASDRNDPDLDPPQPRRRQPR